MAKNELAAHFILYGDQEIAIRGFMCQVLARFFVNALIRCKFLATQKGRGKRIGIDGLELIWLHI